MARLYSNENFPLEVVNILRTLGHDVLTSHEANRANQSIPDDEVLSYAAEQGRALLTINRRDFIALHKKTSNHAGIVVCTQDVDFVGQAQRIHQAISNQALLKNQLLRLIRPNKK